MKKKLIPMLIQLLIGKLYGYFGPAVMPEKYRLKISRMEKNFGELAKEKSRISEENHSLKRLLEYQYSQNAVLPEVQWDMRSIEYIRRQLPDPACYSHDSFRVQMPAQFKTNLILSNSCKPEDMEVTVEQIVFTRKAINTGYQRRVGYGWFYGALLIKSDKFSEKYLN